ncbi:DNA-3-methyladenine glycosylase I [Dictyobacter aurantiacus]|uniref:DNA-3-methyladenine glycosylase I n=1 Tax=Dictyobacter aurantiacus TaxID=1936993 RepID=A0A401ZL51_9CHLR|nr:DNA-3-methyladenine glycosylase I [Dictyobacter aurantiacus]GCE07607.1 DNA-3-methyladenine glycosylase I [Dictyobacter aurantiacus]
MTTEQREATNEERRRCQWAQSNELFYVYHDEEWGVPVHDDRLLFEMLNLEGAQAGLSWLTILKKRENYRAAFDNFDAHKIAQYDASKKESLLGDEGIVRNRLKINAVVENAKAMLEVQCEFGSFDRYIWRFVNGQPLEADDRQRAVAISEHMSKDLKKRGFRFVGATICYAFMQAVGMVNDHTDDCFRAGMQA